MTIQTTSNTLNFIGTGSAFNVELGNNGAYIKQGRELFLIDCGASAFGRIRKSDMLQGIEEIHVLLTHTHTDHIGSIGSLIEFVFFGGLGKFANPAVTIYAPNAIGPANRKVSLVDFLTFVGIEDHMYHLVQFESTCHIPNIGHVEAVAVEHVPHLNCFAYIINLDNGKRVYYSGDSNMIPTRILRELHEGNFDAFYQDTCKAEYPGNVHLPITTLAELVKPHARHAVHIMHLDNACLVEEASELGFQVVTA